MSKPLILTMGDPAGIGPEIILKSFLDPSINQLPQVVYGDFKIMKLYQDLLKINEIELVKIHDLKDAKFETKKLNVLDFDIVNMAEFKMGQVSATAGNAAFNYIIKAIEDTKAGLARAIVTAPINKEALHTAGHIYPGHTEIFAKYSGVASDYAMLLYDDKLSVIHVSTHVALTTAIAKVTPERVATVIRLAHESLTKIKGRAPKIGVAGLNPHASEHGLFGNEEAERIIPAIEKAKKLYDVVGPIAPDAIFNRGLKGEFDVIIAMYHDQGHIPFKLFAFDSGVNTTVGLPILRTSVDHGTAFNRAGKGTAQHSSMMQAIRLADKMTK
jgi:4-hydroxythreonine-4-phosphate dehydrogenase